MYIPMPFFNPCSYCRNAQRCRIQSAILHNYYRAMRFQILNDSPKYPQTYDYISYLNYNSPETEVISRQTKEFTLSELENYNGSMGKPAYVAVNGIVYDVSNEETWGGASHFGLIAGKDLSSQFQGCHGNDSILAKLPKIGILKK